VRRFLAALALAAAALLLLAAEPARRETVDLVLAAEVVLPMDEAGSIHRPGAVAIRGGKIVAVGPAADIRARYAGKAVEEPPSRLLMPGLINTHTHAAMTLLRGLADDLTLDAWLHDHIFPAEAKNVSAQFVYDGTRLAALEMIQGGTTCFADMYYFESEAARAVDEAGLRGVLGETFLDFPVPDHKDLAEALAYMSSYAKKWKGHARVVPAVAPHAVYTCSRETLIASRDFAHAHGLPLLIHISETRKELEDARTAWKKSPVAYLAEIGFFDPPSSGGRLPIIGAHGVWLEGPDRTLVKQYGVSLSHCPESNMKLSSGIAETASWAREGLIWSIGTDGPAGSNNDLSMFEAMDFTGKLAKVSTSDPTALPAATIVAAATREGARSLGLLATIGTLEPGKDADVISVSLAGAHVQPWEDPYSTLVYSAKASDVQDVWVAGRRLLKAGRPTTLDSATILKSARAWRERVRKSLAAPKAAGGTK
jgi:5-methylthioadenosine/S-adenosylhomocysteine deaminase